MDSAAVDFWKRDYVIHATHECVIHEKVSHRVFTTTGRLWSYLELLEVIRNRFRLSPSSRLVLIYLDENSCSVDIVNDMDLQIAVRRQKNKPLVVKVGQKCSPPHVRVLYGETQRLITLPQCEAKVSYGKLHSSVRKLFQLPESVKFAFRCEEPGSGDAHMTVANDEELEYVLETESPNCLRLDVDIVEKANANDISDSTGERTSKTCSDVVTILSNGTIRVLALTPDELESSCKQFLKRIREVFTLRSSTQLELGYTRAIVNLDDPRILPVLSEHVVLVKPVVLSKGEKLKDALSRQERPWLLFASVVQKTSYVVKVSHNGTLRRLTLHSDEFHFSFEKFQSSIRGLFKLSPSTSFVLNYIDEDQDNITIMEDEDLRDALVLQSLDPLKVTIVITEGKNDINLNPEIALPSGL